MRAVVIAVNDLSDCCESVEAWRTQSGFLGAKYPSGNAIVNVSITGEVSVISLGSFWDDDDDLMRFLGKLAGDDGVLFCLDSEVEDQAGEDVLARLLVAKPIDPIWWGCILTGGQSDTSDRRVRSRASGIPDFQLQRHYLGAAQDWLGSIMDLVLQLRERIASGQDFKDWSPALYPRRVDVLKAAIHDLQNLPCRVDVQVIAEILCGLNDAGKAWELDWTTVCSEVRNANFGATADGGTGDMAAVCQQVDAAVVGVTTAAIGPAFEQSGWDTKLLNARRMIGDAADGCPEPANWDRQSAEELYAALGKVAVAVDDLISQLSLIRDKPQ